MTRNTVGDRARKARIREREYRQAAARLRKLDNITDEQLDELKKIKAAEVKNKPLMSSTIADWQELHAMGVVKEQEGALILTSTGAQVVSSQEASQEKQAK